MFATESRAGVNSPRLSSFVRLCKERQSQMIQAELFPTKATYGKRFVLFPAVPEESHYRENGDKDEKIIDKPYRKAVAILKNGFEPSAIVRELIVRQYPIQDLPLLAETYGDETTLARLGYLVVTPSPDEVPRSCQVEIAKTPHGLRAARFVEYI
jgi:hypothetical protein